MRFAVTVLVFISTLFLYAADKPAHYQAAKAWIAREARLLAYKKDIEIAGLKFLTRAEVEPLLPLTNTTFWWWLNGPLVEAGLRQNSLIEDVQVKRCRALSFNCFHVAITERTPAFFTIVGNNAWLAGSDGGIIKPVSAEWLSQYIKGPDQNSSAAIKLGALAEELRIPVVTGLLSGDSSADVVKARFAALRRAMDIIEQGVGARVSYVEPVGESEIRVKFFGHNFSATFDAKPDDIWKDHPEVLADRSARLKKVLAEFGPNIDRLVSVDLAFDKLAVIKTN